MNNLLITILSLSASGSVLAGLLLLLKSLTKNRIGKAFLYYLWIVVLLRLCLPFGVSLPVPTEWLSNEASYQSENQGPTSGHSLNHPLIQMPNQVPEEQVITAANNGSDPVDTQAEKAGGNASSLWLTLAACLKNPSVWLAVWATGALFCIVWNVYGYIRFTTIIRRTATPPAHADLAVFQEFRESNCVDFMCSESVRTPMLFGMLKPTIVVPSGAYAQNKMAEHLRDIIKHELTHYRRHDLLYKWFAMTVTSLHWFNPLMVLVRREMSRACELSCDEAVIRFLTPQQKQHYGETLLSLAMGQTIPKGILATTMCEEKEQLKERLVSIMNYKTKTWTSVLLSLVLLFALMSCSTVNGLGKEVTQYEKYGLTVAIPNEYIDQVLVFKGLEGERLEGTNVISVYEKRSFEECRAEMGEDSYAGYLFSIARYTQAQYEQFLTSDGSGQSFFAKDDTYYYGWFIPTEVQFYRSGDAYQDENEWAKWTELNEKCSGIKTDFITRNHLTPYSDREFKDKEFTYDSEHLYFIYYPYYADQATATQQGFHWQDVAYCLVLSQPATQGDGGIWCVERWYDNYGSLYYAFPKVTDQCASDYYANLQSMVDSGDDGAERYPEQVALKFVQNTFHHMLATEASFQPIEGKPAGAASQ